MDFEGFAASTNNLERSTSWAVGDANHARPFSSSSLQRSHSLAFAGTAFAGTAPLAPHSNKSVLVRTTSGFQVALKPLEEFRELQCGVCHNVIHNAVHAPCGHSFCQVHLEADSEAWNELEQQAARLRELTVAQGFSVRRALEALAALGEGDAEQATALCAKTSGLEGRAVRVRPDVKEPQFQWGMISHSSIGVVTKDEADHAWVSFPEYNEWHCLTRELEVEPIADQVRLGTVVKVRAGRMPRRGLGHMEGDSVGTVVLMNGSQVTLVGRNGIWAGFVDELEVVPPDTTNGIPCRENIQAAVTRVLTGKGEDWKTKGQVLPQLVGLLQQVEVSGDYAPICLMIQGAQRNTMMHNHGCVDLLRAIGLERSRWNPTGTICIFEPILPPEVGDETGESVAQINAMVRAAASDALQELAGQIGPLPEAPPAEEHRHRVIFRVDPEFFAAGVPFEELYNASLRPALIPAIAPRDESWSWQQRGWDGEGHMVRNLQVKLPRGNGAEVVRKQTEAEAQKVAKRLCDQGLDAVVEEDKESNVLDEATHAKPPRWIGRFPQGSRVLFNEQARSILPPHFDMASVGTVISQANVRAEGSNAVRLHYFVQVPKTSTLPMFPEEALEPAVNASAIQPGVKVRINPGPAREPVFGWGRVQGSDIGVVHRVNVDGVVEVFFLTQDRLWRGALQDLDTTGLPEPMRTSCPVCLRPFPSGQKLSVDIAVDAQIRRMQNLLSGARLASNSLQEPKERPKLLRSRTHQEELRCNICFDLLVSPVTLPCGHSYCKHHIQIWLMESDKCPVCRVRVLTHQARKPDQRQRLRTAAAVFNVAVEDDEGSTTANRGASGQHSVNEGLELHVNEMLEKQVIRFFPKELQARDMEVATEVWDMLQKRQDGCLGRLRAFLEQFRAGGVAHLVRLGLDGPDMPLPGTRDGTLLLLASEQGLPDVVEDLIQRGADPLHTTTATFGSGTSALQLAAGQGRVDVVRVLLGAAEWDDERYADALGASIGRGQSECIQLLLEHRDSAELRNCIGFTALLTAVQAGNAEAIALLVERHGDIEARTERSGLMVLGAGRAHVNGAYQEVGELNGRPLYANAYGVVVYCDGWWKIADSREAAEKGDAHIYSMPAPHYSSPEPPVGQWTLDGHRPVPNTPAPVPAPSLERLAEAGQAATPLLLSAQLGLATIVQVLVEAHANVDARMPSSKRSALHIACAIGDVGVLRVLLGINGGAVDLCPRDAVGLTPLHLACQAGHTLIVQALLETRPTLVFEALEDPGDGTAPPPSPLVLAAGCGQVPLHVEPSPPGAPPSYLAVVRLLLEANMEPFCTPETAGALHAAARAGMVAVIEELTRVGADASAVDESGCPPLLAALLSGASARTSPDSLGPQAAAARSLFRAAGASALASRESDNFTALMAASALGDTELVQELLTGGADLAAIHAGVTAMGHGVAIVGVGEIGAGWDMLDQLLLAHDATPALPGRPLCPRGHPLERLASTRCNRKPVCDKCRQQNIHHQAVFWTCWECDHDLCISCAQVPAIVCLPPGAVPGTGFGHAQLPDEILQALQCNGGSTLMTSDLGGWQPLHFAAVAGKRPVAAHLLQSAADPSAQDYRAMGPLHWAATLGHAAVVELLLESGASAEAPDVEGRLPLALIPPEALRYAFASEEADSREVCAHEVQVTGSGQADGVYVRLPGEDAATGSDTSPGGRRTRPKYQRADGVPFVIQWQEDSGWCLCQLVGHESVCVFRSDVKDVFRCPTGAWVATEIVKSPAGEARPVAQVSEALPWRAGALLLRATPPELRPPMLRTTVEALPARWPPAGAQTATQGRHAIAGVNVTTMSFGPDGMRIEVPAGMAPPPPDAMLQALMDDMMRRGGPPPACPTQ